MQSAFIEFFLIIAFFVAFKLYDIYVATMVIMLGASLQLLITRVVRGRFDKKQCMILGILFLFGGLTLYFRNPIFIKWKPTVVFWLLGIAFLLTHFFAKKTLIERMLSPAFDGKAEVPLVIWKRLNLAWALFFLLLGVVNVVVAYYFTTEVWVNFKLYGILGSLFCFAMVQSMFLSRCLGREKR